MINYFIEQASTAASKTDFLFDTITITVGIWFLIVQGFIVYLLIKYRRGNSPKAKYIAGEDHHESRWVHIPHYLVIICDIAIIALTIPLWGELKVTPTVPDLKIRAIGQQWSWVFVHPGADGVLDTPDDIRTVNDLRLQVNKKYHVEIQSRDVLHDLSIPVFRFKQDAIPGRTILGWFEPTKTGNFSIQCAEMCGIGHGLMAARVHVQTDEKHKKWIASWSQNPQQNIAKEKVEPFTKSLTASF